MIEQYTVRPMSGLTDANSRTNVSGWHAPSNFWKRWLHEPLVHFLLIGGVLFAGYVWLSPPAQTGSNRVEITAADIKQLQTTWMAQWQRLPTADELNGLIDNKIRQEILYREGLTLGLDQNDEIIKRRLAQKMEFLAEDVSTIGSPGPEELRAWFAKNSAKFTLPGQLTFRHIYFSPDKRGEQAQRAAEKALKSLSGKPAGAAADFRGDRFVDQNYFPDISQERVTKVFGSKFSDALFKLTTSASWQGPLESGLGWHLVWIESVNPGRVPSFDEVDPTEMNSEWTSQQREQTKQEAYAAIKRRYEIGLPK